MNQETVTKIDKTKVCFLRYSNHVHQLEVRATLGSSDHDTVVLKGECAQPKHCLIELRNYGIYISDLTKGNPGILVNHRQVVSQRLFDGDTIQIGEETVSIIFANSDEIKSVLKTENPIFKGLLRVLPSMADSDEAVLILGESGSGKELIAQALHQFSPRRHRPFVAINCGALTPELVESELFGHIRGSFTGASADRKGAFETARGGTLFLDEIGDLPLSLQPKLLRALENREIKPVGSDRSIKTEVRIVAATHKPLEELVREGKFRQDLYYRLNVLTMNLPPLRERREDFRSLLSYFCREYRISFTISAMDRLQVHKWPGNIRELRNFIVRCKTYYGAGPVQPQDVESLLPIKISDMDLPKQPSTGEKVLKAVERQILISRLIENNGNQKKTAQELGLPKSTLHDKIRHHGIDLKSVLQQV